MRSWKLLALHALLLVPNDASVELHAHLFMKQGMTWAFKGEFDGPLTASSYNDRFAIQVNPFSLDHSGAAVVVVSLYAHPLFVSDLRDSVRKQIRLAHEYAAKHPQWILATGPAEARRALESGKRILVLHLEGASGILETDEDLREFVDLGGIRIVAPLHLTDDHYGGVALLKGLAGLSSPWAWLKAKLTGSPINDRGLTDEGREKIRKLARHNVWIDLTHASDRAQEDIRALKLGQPPLYTHTVLRKYHGAERGISDRQLDWVKSDGGIIGLMPSETMLEDTIVSYESCVNDCSRQCGGGIAALSVQYTEFVNKIGADAVMLGSDFHGGVPHLKPSCRTETRLDEKGLWEMSLVPDVWKALAKTGAPVPSPLSRTVEKFLLTWEQVPQSL